ncbi:MAG: hypothetical protein IJ015_04715 [Ruminococcus sp.]|nr:hypothetical protein [Ruminococcus sp.]
MIEIFTILSSTLLLISTIKKESLNTLCVFSIMAIVGTVYNIYFLNQTIKFSDDKIIVRNFLGFKRTFSYSEIQSFIIKKRSTKYNIYRVVYFYTDKKKFSVETTNVNYADFFKKVNDEYKRLNDGNNLPTRKP